MHFKNDLNLNDTDCIFRSEFRVKVIVISAQVVWRAGELSHRTHAYIIGCLEFSLIQRLYPLTIPPIFLSPRETAETTAISFPQFNTALQQIMTGETLLVSREDDRGVFRFFFSRVASCLVYV